MIFIKLEHIEIKSILKELEHRVIQSGQPNYSGLIIAQAGYLTYHFFS